LSLATWQVTLTRDGIEDGSQEGLDSTCSEILGDLEAPLKPGQWHGMRADSPQMTRLFAEIERVASFDVPVLVVGETGTGKELVARAIHSASRRAGKRLVSLNCGAIHGETAHSRLFGHEKGAFTGASSESAGAFREADGGTLFLDEIGELPMLHQTALLRVLESREVVPMGASRPVPVDYRLVAATHRDLPRRVGAGGFREDLYYRLDVAVLRVPPLRERAGDIPGLARHFLATLAPGGASDISSSAVEALLAHSWPGNVRELRNTVMRAILASDGGPIEVQHVVIRETSCPSEMFPGSSLQAPSRRMAAFGKERSHILSALDHTGGNRKEAARLLGVARSTLYARMQRLGLS
jgi:DNA-binding NtrC family response regulator